MIMELKRKENKEEVIKKEKIGKGWNVGVDEELTMEKRKRR